MKNNSKNVSLTPYDDIFSTEESRQQNALETIQQLPIAELVPFKDHPFQVVDDDRMKETVESVKEYGVLVPIIARPLETGGYEIVSGHRRKRACELAGIDTVPVIVRKLDNDEATIIMVDSNLQRESILPSERAKAYKMKFEALQRKAGRPLKENCTQVGYNFQGKKSIEVLAEKAPDSKTQIQRYLNLNNLDQTLMDKVDHGQLAFTPAVELSFLKPTEQQALVAALETTQATPSLSQAQRMKKLSQEGQANEENLTKILSEDKKPLTASVTLSQETLRRFFPKSYTTDQMQKVIIKLLESWMRKRQKDQER